MTDSASSSSEYKLFVGNLPNDATLAEVEAAFAQFGKVIEIHMMDGTRSRSGQSSAFVKYYNMDSCSRAVRSMHMRCKIRPTDSNPIAVKFAKVSSSPLRSPLSDPSTTGLLKFKDMSVESSCGSTTAHSSPAGTPLPSPTQRVITRCVSKIFVGGLPQYVNQDDLIAIFAPFGRIESVHLMSSNKSRSGQSCAFVNYYSKDSSRLAIDALHGKYKIEEGSILVRFADNTDDDSGRVLKRIKITDIPFSNTTVNLT
jgi:RNA recognition motif-containing protein